MNTPKILKIILTAVLLMACTNNTRIALLAGVAGMAISCDVGQTYAASNGGRWDGPWEEGNPLLGPSPAPLTLAFVGVAGAVAVTAVAISRLPTWAKYAVLGTIVVVETAEVAYRAPVFGPCGEGVRR